MATSTALRGEGPFKKSTTAPVLHFTDEGKLGNRDVRILYVEDNKTLQRILEKSFEKLKGFHLDIARRCEDVGELTLDEYDFIILDENLGSENKTGSVFAGEIKESFKGKIIHYSTEDEVNSREDLGHFNKKFDKSKKEAKKELVDWVKNESLVRKDPYDPSIEEKKS